MSGAARRCRRLTGAVSATGDTGGVKLPRVKCPHCERPIAAGPVASRMDKGRVWRHDPPGQPRVFGGPLVSCPGSLAVVDVPAHGFQPELDGEDVPAGDTGAGGTLALF